MGDRNKKSKEGKDPRRSARQTGKTCGRPFKAPRPVKQAETDIVIGRETLLQDSELDDVYHVTYTDGDEEELSQVELRDGYVLGLSAEIVAQWKTYKLGNKDTSGEEAPQDSEDEGSDVEGSTYDTSSEDEVFIDASRLR